MADYTKAQLGRASAVLTTGEVAGTRLDTSRIKDRLVTVDFSFTLGMLTNGIVRFYGSQDGTTFDLIKSGVTSLTETHTADAEFQYVIQMPPGVNFFRASVQGTGTVTNSLCDFMYRFDRPGAV